MSVPQMQDRRILLLMGFNSSCGSVSSDHRILPNAPPGVIWCVDAKPEPARRG